MPKENSRKKDIDFLTLFKRSLALSFTALIFGVQTSYADITVGSSDFNTNINTNGDTTDITGGFIKPGTDTGFHHFSKFEIENGHIVNLIFGDGANRYVNLVDRKISIDGLFNSFKSLTDKNNGIIGGDVIFVSPLGFVVGSTGILNVGSLQTITPAKSSYDALIGLGKTIDYQRDIAGLNSDGDRSQKTTIDGKIFSAGNIDISDGKDITLGQNSALVSGFNQEGFAKTTAFGFDLSQVVNADGIVSGDYLVSDSEAGIKISSVKGNIASGDVGSGLIHSTGDISFDAAGNSDIVIGSKVYSGGNIDIDMNTSTRVSDVVLNNDVTALGDINSDSYDSFHLASGKKLSGNSIKIDSNIATIVDGVIEAKNGISFNERNAGASFVQGASSEIINKESGKIRLNAVNLTTSKITNEAIKTAGKPENGDIQLVGTLNVNDTIKTTNGGNIYVDGKTGVTQSDGDFTAFESAGDLAFINTSVGTASKYIDVNVKGDVSVTGASGSSVYLNAKDSDLTIAGVSLVEDAYIKGDKSITIKQDFLADNAINIEANDGISMSSGSYMESLGDNGITLLNKSGNNISLQEIYSDKGVINVTNNAENGSILLNNNLTANNDIVISSVGGVTQLENTYVDVFESASDITITNTGIGDITLDGDITSEQGNVVVKNTSGVVNPPLPGNINVNGNIEATTGYVDITSEGDYSQSGVINAYGKNHLNDSVTLNVNGEAGLGKITGSKNINISAGSILLNSLLSSSTGEVVLNAATGGIQQSGNDKTIDAATSVSLTAKGDIGQANGQSIVVSTVDNKIEATSTAGGVSLTGDNTSIELNDISSATDLDITVIGAKDIIFNKDLSGLTGDVTFALDKTLDIASSISTSGDIELTSNNGDIVLRSLVSSTDGNVTLNALKGEISQASDYDAVAINSNGIVELNALGDIGSADDYIQIIAEDVVNADGGNIYLQSPNNLKIGNINSTKDTNYLVDIKTTNQSQGNIDLAGLIKGSSIKLDAAQGIVQSATGKTIDATGILELIAGSESIGDTGKGVNFSASSVSADAAKSVVLIGEDTDINTSSIKATENIDLSTKIVDATKGKGKITIANELKTDTGYIKIDSQKALDISENISAGTSVTLSADGGITQAADAVIKSGLNDAAEVDSGYITIKNSGAGDISLTSVVAENGSINVTSSVDGGNIILNSVVQSTDANIVLNATKGNVIQTFGTGASVDAGQDITVNAKNIGSSVEDRLIVDAKGSLYAESTNLFIKDDNANLTLGVINSQNIDILASGDILQDSESRDAIISDGLVKLTSVDGKIGQDKDNGVAVQITGAGVLDATATDINLSGTSLVTGKLDASNDININTVAENGSVHIKDDMKAGGNITINSGNGVQHSSGKIHRAVEDGHTLSLGTIEITTSAGDINLSSIENKNGAITIDSANNVILNSLVESTSGKISIDAGNVISQNSDSVALLSDNGVSLDANKGIENIVAKATNGSRIEASVDDGSLSLTAEDTNLYTADISAGNGTIALTTINSGSIIIDEALSTINGDINLTSAEGLSIDRTLKARNIKLTAKDGSISQLLSLDKALDASGDITLSATDIDADGKNVANVGSLGNSLSVNAGGAVTVSKANGVYLKSPTKSINLGEIAANGDVSILTTESGDINIGNSITGGNVTLDAAGGVYQTVDGKTISAEGLLDLYARDGSVGNDKAISFSSSSVSAQATDSVILIGEDVDINTSSIRATKNIDLSTVVTDPNSTKGNINVVSSLQTTDGYIKLVAANELSLTGDLDAGQSVTLGAGGNILLNTIKAGTSITVDADGSITQNASKVLEAENIELTAGGNIGESVNKAIQVLTSDSTVSARGTNIYLKSSDALNLGEIIAASKTDSEIASRGDVNISTTLGQIDVQDSVVAKNVTIDAQGSIVQSSSEVIDVTGLLDLTSQSANIGGENTPIKFTAEQVKATANNGLVSLQGVGSDIKTSTITASDELYLSTVSSGENSGNITIDDAIIVDGKIVIDSDGSLNVLSGGEVKSTNSSVELESGGQMTLADSVTAKAIVRLTSEAGIIQTSGSVVSTDNSIFVVNRNSNDVTLNSIQADSAFSVENFGASNITNATANENILITNYGTLDEANITVGGITSNNGHVSIVNTTGGDIVLTSLVKSTNGDVLIDTQVGTDLKGNVYQYGVEKTIQAADNITINAKQVGTNGNNLIVNSTNGKLDAKAVDVYIKNKDGGLTIGQISASNSVNLHSNGDIAQADLSTASIDAGSGGVNLTTNSSVGKSNTEKLVVKSTGDINVNSNVEVAGKAENVYIASDGAFNIGEINVSNKLDLSTLVAEDGTVYDITLKELISATDVKIDASGSILQDSNLDKTIDAGKLTLIAGKDIGNTSESIDFTANDSLSATAGESIVLNSFGKSLDTNWIQAGKSIDLTTTGAGVIKVSSDLQANNGYIRLVAQDGLNLGNHLIDASENVTLISKSGDISLGANVVAGQNITIDAADDIIQSSGVLDAGQNIDLTAKGAIGESVDNAINLKTGDDGTVKAVGSDVYLSSTKTLNLDEITANSGTDRVVNIKTTSGDINIQKTVSGNSITLDAYGNIDQVSNTNTNTKTITATKDLKLISQNGNIGNNNAIIFEADTIEATASNGSVSLAGEKTDIKTSNITAAENIDITTIESGNIYVDSTISTGGLIRLDSAGELIINESITSSGSEVSLLADKNITLGALVEATAGKVVLDTDSAIIQTVEGNAIDANVVDLVAEQIGTAEKYINVSVSDKVNADGVSIYIESDDAVFKVGSINSKGLYTNESVNIRSNVGDVNLKGLLKGNKVDIASEKNVTQSSDSSIYVDATTLTIKAVDKNNNKGNIGTSEQALNVQVSDRVNVADANDVYLKGVKSDLHTGNISAENVSISSDKGLNLKGLIKATLAKLTAENSITQDASFNGNQSIEATTIDLTSTSGSIGGSKAIDFKGNSIKATANQGSVVLNGVESDIYTDSIKAGQNIDLSTETSGDITIESDIETDGYISLNSAGDLTVSDSLKGSSVTLVAQDGDVILSELVTSTSGNITVESSNDIVQTVDTKVLDSNSGIVLKSGSSIGSEDQSLVLSAQDSIKLDASNVYLTADNSNLTISSINQERGDKTLGEFVLDAKGNDANISVVDVVKANKVKITNNSAIGDISVKDVDSSTSYEIANNADGMLTIDGKLSNSADSSIVANNAGTNSGINITSNSVINNKNGSLTITNRGSKGLFLGGELKNNINDGTQVSIKNNAGALQINADIENGLAQGSTNLISIINSGVDSAENGLIFSGGKIDNYGSLELENKNGTMSLDGQINAHVGSSNTFKNSSGEDFSITSIVKNIGNTVTFENSGGGSLILAETSEFIVGNSGDSVGVLNINNTSVSDNSALVINGDVTSSNGGSLNISNTGGSGIDINETSNISIDDVTITNNKGDIDINNGAIIDASNILTINNNTTATDLNIDGSLMAKEIILNSNNSNINIAHNKVDGNIVADNVTINATNANIINHSNKHTQTPNAVGISASEKLTINAKNVGKLDNTLNDIVTNGFVVDENNSVNVKASQIDVTASETANIHSQNGLNIENISAQSAFLTAVDGDITSNKMDVDNLYMYTMADDGVISVSGLNVSKLTGEAGGKITIDSLDDLVIDSLLSRNESIEINSNGDTKIAEIAAPKDIAINVFDEKLTIFNLGKVQRADDIIPEEVTLFVNDAKNISDNNKNGKLDIFNAYVQNKVNLKADTITAQVYDISDSSTKGEKRVDESGKVATGFHNANKDGKPLIFDIQGANYPQEDVGSKPHNPNYKPDENDKKALSVHLTLGDSAPNSVYGANFEKLYSDYAFIDSVNDSGDVSNINIESGVIGKYGIIRNNKLRLDIANSPLEDFPINKHFDDVPDKAISNKTSFNSTIFDDIEIIDPATEVDEIVKNYNPHRIVENPDLDKKVASPNSVVADKSVVKADASTALRNINWVVRDKNDVVIGANSSTSSLEVKDLVSVSKQNIVFSFDNTNYFELKNGEILRIELQYKDAIVRVDGKVVDKKGHLVYVNFINLDKISENILLFLSMCQENL